MKEVDDKMKHDLALVQCDNSSCEERGDRTICYQDWKTCPRRVFWASILKREGVVATSN